MHSNNEFNKENAYYLENLDLKYEYHIDKMKSLAGACANQYECNALMNALNYNFKGLLNSKISQNQRIELAVELLKIEVAASNIEKLLNCLNKIQSSVAKTTVTYEKPKAVVTACNRNNKKTIVNPVKIDADENSPAYQSATKDWYIVHNDEDNTQKTNNTNTVTEHKEINLKECVATNVTTVINNNANTNNNQGLLSTVLNFFKPSNFSSSSFSSTVEDDLIPQQIEKKS